MTISAALIKLRREAKVLQSERERIEAECQAKMYAARMSWERVWFAYVDEAKRCGICPLCDLALKDCKGHVLLGGGTADQPSAMRETCFDDCCQDCVCDRYPEPRAADPTSQPSAMRCGFKLFGCIPCDREHGHDGFHSGVSGVGERVTDPTSQPSADSLDAARFRWLQDKARGWSPHMDGSWFYRLPALPRAKSLGEAIDAARAADPT